MKLQEKKKLLKRIVECKKALQKQRDELRELIDEMENIADCSDEAIHYIESAVDHLSQLL
jgi:hypothetical protein